MSGLLLGAGALAYVAGLVAVFAGTRLKGRLAGLATMAVGSLLALAAGAPARAVTWWLVLASAATLAGLLAFAVYLERRAAEAAGEPLPIDDEPV